MRNLMLEIFSINGRLNRQKYFLNILIVYVLFATMSAIDPNLNSPIILVLGAFLLYQLLRMKIKRFHDINRSGLYCWGGLVPFYNLYLLAILFFEEGTHGSNIYGQDLLENKRLPNTKQPPANNQSKIIMKIINFLKNLILIICVFILSFFIIKALSHAKDVSVNFVGSLALTVIAIFIYHNLNTRK